MKASAFKMAGGEFLMRKYGLTKTQAERFLSRTPLQREVIEKAHEGWRAKHGYPAADAPISRGTFLAFLNEAKFIR